MKILCVIDSLGSGGAQRQIVELALGFMENGHNVSFLTYHHIPFHNNILEINNISITCIQEPNYIKRFFKMRCYIRRGKYDAVLSFLEAASFICELSGIPFRKWKLVVGERSANPNMNKSFKLVLFRLFHVFADFVVANSFTNIRLIHSVNPLLKDSKCKVIYNIVDFNQWKPSNKYFPRKEGKLKIVVAASHRYIKNLNGLIDALLLLTDDERNNLVVEWYGDRLTSPFLDNSFLEARRKILALKLDKVISFRPATLEVISKVQEADVIGLFSFYEGLPNSVCEGMACAKPVICSAVSDIPELLSHNTNLLYNPSESDSIVKTIRYMLNLDDDQLNQIGSNNLKIAHERFNRNKIISDYLLLFK